MDFKRVILSFYIIIGCASVSFAQDSDKQTKVYLKDGSVLVGVILEDTDYYIKLSTATMDTIKIGYKLIFGVGDEVKHKRTLKYKTPIAIKEKGVFLLATSGVVGQSEGEFNTLRNSLAIGKRMSKQFNLGAEIGHQNHIFSSQLSFGRSSFLTLSLFGKYFLNTKSNRWLLDGSVGYGIPLTEQDFFDYSHTYNGGANGQLNIGRQWGLSKTLSLIFKVGMGYQHVTGDIFTNWNGPVMTSYRQEFLYPSFSVGFEF